MSKEISNKYFDKVMGHQKIKEHLSKMLQEDKLAHALLFYGESGLGKTSLALALAETIVDREITKQYEENKDNKEGHLLERYGEDVFFLRPVKKMLKLEQFLLLQEQINFGINTEKPVVCIVDEMQTMRKEIANSLLKTIEEPPKNFYFIFITSQIDLVLPTILSRCMSFQFLPLPEEILLAELKQKKKLTDIEAEAILMMSNGNVKSALEFLEKGLVTDLEIAIDFLETMAYKKDAYLVWIEQAFSYKSEQNKEIFYWLLFLLRDLLFLKVGVEKDLIKLSLYKERLEKLAKIWTKSDLQKAFVLVEEATVSVDRNINNKLIWDNLCINMLEFIEK